MNKAPDWQGMADKEAKQIVREALIAGRTVHYSMCRLIELKLSLKTIRAVYRPGGAYTPAPPMPPIRGTAR